MHRFFPMLLTVWLTATLTFFALHILPGDAISAQLAQTGAGRADIETLKTEMGLNSPIIAQYTQFMTDLAQGDLGQSLLSGQPVSEMIRQRFWPTATLALGAMLVAIIAGISLGIAGAFHTPLSRLARLWIHLSLSAPIYWTGTLAIVIFSAQLRWLPHTGTGSLKSLILPVAVLGFHTMGGIARVVQANVSEASGATFVWVARSKGLSERYIVWRHILRVGLLPVITVITLQTGFLLSGAVITESLFVRPGIGRLLLDSAIKQDYPIVQGLVILSATVYIILNTLADVAHRLIDPRITA